MGGNSANTTFEEENKKWLRKAKNISKLLKKLTQIKLMLHLKLLI
ncbi:protein of unknown function [Brochothrix thermosphacta]|nr:hypothetical protein BTH160X_290062 [Brochothrix thermosphacta]SPN70691.1 protein of unknown function [Brochothrix thermosphacta]SPP27348.1 hypothetical protein BTTAP_140064 [Brochothrix thermosphacta]